jgi:Spy/CpxP family protein refolding chaperone
MKKIILSALVLSMVIAVQAQEIPERKTDRSAPHGNMQHKKRGGHDKHEMMKQLNLTDAQKEQFKTQRESFRQQMDELKKNDNITVKEWKSRMEGLRKDQKAKMDGILTTDQKAKMGKMKAEGKARHEGMMKQRGEKMKAELGLTAEQSAKMDKNRAEMGQKMKAIREDKNLNDDQKRDKTKELMKQQKENMKSILTKEQMDKMNERKGQHHHMDDKKADSKETI